MTRPIPGGQPTPARVGAAVDAGSNSVHLLVARVVGHRLEPLDDESTFLGLGAAVDATGSLGRERAAALAATLGRYADIARGMGASQIAFLGTEPLRRAADGAEVAARVEASTGVALHIVTHEEEAQLTAIGVTGGCGTSHSRLIVDVGGGSTELVVIGPDTEPAAWGVALGSARLTEAVVRHDPPTADEVSELRRRARIALVGTPPVDAQEIVAVGGTASNLARVIPGASADGDLTRERLALALEELVAEPAASYSARHGINPKRGPLLPAGVAIVEAILERFGAGSLRVSEAGVRQGAILAATWAGDGWRERLPELVLGWEDADPSIEPSTGPL